MRINIAPRSYHSTTMKPLTCGLLLGQSFVASRFEAATDRPRCKNSRANERRGKRLTNYEMIRRTHMPASVRGAEQWLAEVDRVIRIYRNVNATESIQPV